MNLASRTVAVAGATGAVGKEMLRLLADREVPKDNIRALASERSAGAKLPYADTEIGVSLLQADAFKGCDLALFAISSGLAKDFAPAAMDAGCKVVDNSSAFRMDPAVPLVVPEVNPEALKHADPARTLIANPNCTTIISLTAINPIRKAFGLERAVIATYQAVSGAGAPAMEELDAQTRAYVAGDHDAAPSVFSEPCAFNVFSHDSAIDPVTGQNVEEDKFLNEGRKIWNDPAARLFGTCMRVGVFRSHTIVANIQLKTPATRDEVLAVLNDAPGVVVQDDWANNDFPTARKAADKLDVMVGRVRPDPSAADPVGDKWPGFALLIAGDQLLKGAAWNAVQIAEAL